MTLLENQSNNTQKQSNIVLVQEHKKEISFRKSIFISTLLHPAFVLFIVSVIFISKLLGFSFNIFEKPKLKMRDIEFTIVTREATPINKNTRYRSDINSRAGGKHDPRRKESEPRPQSASSSMQRKASRASSASERVQQIRPQQRQSNVQKQLTKSERTVAKPVENKTAPRPKTVATQPRPSVQNKSAFKVQAPKPSNKIAPGPLAGPVSSNGSSKKASSSSSFSSFSPMLAPSSSSASSKASSGRKFSSKGAYGSQGNAGNPSPGNPKGTPGIDAIREPDFGPYMKEVERRIKANWTPPNGGQSKKVVLLFTIARDGRLLSLKVVRSSGFKADDDAAIAAVKLTAPFRPLPAEYRGSSVDINFTFDFYASSARRY